MRQGGLLFRPEKDCVQRKGLTHLASLIAANEERCSYEMRSIINFNPSHRLSI